MGEEEEIVRARERDKEANDDVSKSDGTGRAEEIYGLFLVLSSLVEIIYLPPSLLSTIQQTLNDCTRTTDAAGLANDVHYAIIPRQLCTGE